jgi:IS30 family transposase
MARRPKRPALLLRPKLRRVVASRLQDDWSPEQIAGWLAAAKYPESPDMRVSHETIYRSLYLQTRNVLHRQLLDRLRTKRRMRKGKKWSTAGQLRGRIIDALSIHDRPAEVAAARGRGIGRAISSRVLPPLRK